MFTLHRLGLGSLLSISAQDRTPESESVSGNVNEPLRAKKKFEAKLIKHMYLGEWSEYVSQELDSPSSYHSNCMVCTFPEIENMELPIRFYI